MKKKKTGIWIAAITFFTLLLIGTFFHKKIDGLFRMKVAAVYPQECRVETESVIELDGEEIPVTTEEAYLSLPAAAVHDGMVFVLETKKVPYGSYEAVFLRAVEVAENAEEAGGDMVYIKDGILRSERVVALFDDRLQDGMRVVEE